MAPSWSWASTTAQLVWLDHMLCRLESRIQTMELKHPDHTDKTNIKVELVIATRAHVGRKNGSEVGVIDCPPVQAIDGIVPRVMGINPSEAPVAFDEQLNNHTILWFAEIAAGDNHARGNRRELHCLVLVSCGSEFLYRRVGYIVWLKSDYVSFKISTRMMTLVIV